MNVTTWLLLSSQGGHKLVILLLPPAPPGGGEPDLNWKLKLKFWQVRKISGRTGFKHK